MIKLTGVNGQPVWLSGKYITFLSRETVPPDEAENAGFKHYTLLVTITGHAYKVKETPQDVVKAQLAIAPK